MYSKQKGSKPITAQYNTYNTARVSPASIRHHMNRTPF